VGKRTTACINEEEGLKQRQMASAIGLSQTYVMHLLRYHDFLKAAAFKIPEFRFRAYWIELQDPYENSRDKAKQDAYKANMFEVIAQRIQEGIPPHKRVRKIKKVTGDDLLDMLPAVNGGDSGSQAPIPVSSILPTGKCAWFSLHQSPVWGLLRWRKQPANPRRSHMISAGFTSRMPYGRGLPSRRSQYGSRLRGT
jgi:hypothetical protein